MIINFMQILGSNCYFTQLQDQNIANIEKKRANITEDDSPPFPPAPAAASAPSPPSPSPSAPSPLASEAVPAVEHDPEHVSTPVVLDPVKAVKSGHLHSVDFSATHSASVALLYA